MKAITIIKKLPDMEPSSCSYTFEDYKGINWP